MTLYVFSDNARTTLAGAIGSGATSLTVAPGAGALFPSPSGGTSFALTLNDVATRQAYEICLCTHRAGDVLTIVRGQEGTAPQSWVIGDLVWNGPTAAQMANMVQGPHMLDGSISPLFGPVVANGNILANAGHLRASAGVSGGDAFTAPILSDLHNASISPTFGPIIGVGNITASTGRVRASLGAFGSGDPNSATLLADWVTSTGSVATFGSIVGAAGYFYERGPNGVYDGQFGFSMNWGLSADQEGGFGIPIGSTVIDAIISLGGFGVPPGLAAASQGSFAVGWNAGTIYAINNYAVGNLNAALGTLGMVIRARWS